MQVILWGGRAACACRYILDYTINPLNILTFILHSFIRLLLNFRFCQIRPIFCILLFWFKLKYACKICNIGPKISNYQTGRFLFQHPLPGIGIAIGPIPIPIPVSVSLSVWMFEQYRYQYESSA